MTIGGAGMTLRRAGMTIGGAGMTIKKKGNDNESVNNALISYINI